MVSTQPHFITLCPPSDLGADLKAHVTVAEVLDLDLFAGVFISTTVCAVLTYHSGLLMMELARAA